MSSTTTFQHATTLHVFDCGNCGGVYAINEGFRERAHRDGRSGAWHCPYCQSSWGYNESEADRLKKRLEREQAARAAAEGCAQRAREDAERQRQRANGYKGQMVRTKKRVGNGVCPCCNRTFSNLARHMKSKHPGYADAPIPEQQNEPDAARSSAASSG